MRKIFAILFILFFVSALPSEAAWFGKKDKQKEETKKEEKGYKGILPNVNAIFEFKRQKNATVVPVDDTKKTNKTDLQKAPFDDPIFMDEIIKKKKNSPFIDDVLYIREPLTKFRDYIQKNPENVELQKYISQVNNLNLLTNDIIAKYSNTQDAQSMHYIWICSVVYRAKLLGNLMYDAKRYSKYMALDGTQYSKQYINSEVQILLSELNKAIYKLEEIDVY